MPAGPRSTPYPVVVQFSDPNNPTTPVKLLESSSIFVQSLSGVTISATEYLNIPTLGGATSVFQLNGTGTLVLTSTNSNLSSLVSNIQTSTVALSAYIAANESSWGTGEGVTDHGALFGLADNDHPQYASSSVSGQIQYVSSYAFGVSTTVNSHLTSAVHWTLATLNSNYINASGDSANAAFYLSSVSAADISATNYYNLPSSTLVWLEAQDIVLLVKNNSPTQPIPVGTPVAIVGAVGGSSDTPLVEPLSSLNTHVPEAYGFANHVAGLAKEEIAADGEGYIIVEGKLIGYDTLTPGWEVGDALYVSSNGQLSNERPPAPYEMHPVGIVLRTQQNNGAILVKIENAPELNDIVGFNLSQTILNGDVIAYDLTTSTFKNVQALNISGSSKFGTVSATVYQNLPTSALSGLSDTNIVTPSYGNSLVWDSNKWVASALVTGGIITNNPGGAAGDIQYNNGAGSFAGTASLNYNAGTNTLNVTNLSATNFSALNFDKLNQYETTSYARQNYLVTSVNVTALNGTGVFETTGYARNNYVLTSTNNSLSSLVDNHIASASVHFTSGSLSGYYAASSWVTGTFATTASLNNYLLTSVNVTAINGTGVFETTGYARNNYLATSVNVTAINGTGVFETTSYARNNYVLTSTNNSLSSLVNNHIASASVHFTSGSLSGYYAASSWVTGTYATTASLQNYLLTSVNVTALNGTGVFETTGYARNNYVLTSTNNSLSSLVNNHIASSTVHFTSGSLSGYYAASSWVTGTYATTASLQNYLLTSVNVTGLNGTGVFATTASLQNYLLTSVNVTALNGTGVFETTGYARNNYVLTSTNNSLSSLVNNHIASSTVHFTSGSLSGYYAASSWVTGTFATTASLTAYETTGYARNNYVLTSTNNSLSSLVTSIQTSTVALSSYIAANEASWLAGGGGAASIATLTDVDGTTVPDSFTPVNSGFLLNWDVDSDSWKGIEASAWIRKPSVLSSFNDFFVNASGDNVTGTFRFGNVTATTFSGTTISAVNVFPASSAKRNWVFYGDPTNGKVTQSSGMWFSANATISGTTAAPTPTLFIRRVVVAGTNATNNAAAAGIFFSRVDANTGLAPQDDPTDFEPPNIVIDTTPGNKIAFVDPSGQLEFASSVLISNWVEGGLSNQLNADAVSADTLYATNNIFSPFVSASTYSENVITVQGSATQLYNVVNNCDTYLVNTTTSAVTVVLPNPTTNFGRTILVSKVEADGSHRGVTVSGNITDNQLSSITMYDPNESLRFISNGTSWTNLDFQKALGIVLVAKNSTSSLITKGTPLRIVGSENNVPTIGPVSAVSGHVPEAMGDMPHCIGLSEHDIPASGFGHVITRGLLYGLDTNSFAAGDDVYIGENGNLINMMPVAPYEQIRVGIVVIGGTLTDGVIYVDLVHPTYINELVGFDIPDTIDDSPSASHYKAIYYASGTRTFTADYIDHGFLVGLGDNDHPQYASSSVSANISTLESNTSTLSSTVTNHIGSAVHWDLATLNANYINASGDNSNNAFYFSSLSATTLSATTYQNLPTSSLSGLADVQITAIPTTNYVLKWNGTKWAPASDNTGAGNLTAAITALSDGSTTYETAGSDTLTVSSNDGSITVTQSASQPTMTIRVNEANVNHNELSGLTTGNPHTQYATLSGSVFTGGVSATTLSATNYSGISLSGSLRDVAITTPTNDHVLTWSAAAGKWVSKAAPGSTGGIANGFSIVDINSASYVLNSTGEDTLYLVNGNAIEIVESTTNTVRVAVVENQITHNNLTGLTTGNPHTQYATLSGSVFTGGVSAASISATNYFNLPSGTAIWNANKLQGVDVTSTTPTTNQALVYDGTKWTPSSLPAGGGGGVTFLSALSDVSAASPTHKDTLVYNSSVGRYVDTPVTPYRLIVHADAGANITLTNQANTEAFFAGSNRNIFKVDLTNFTQARIHARVVTQSASVNNPRIYAEYATTFTTTVGDYLDLGSISVSASLSSATYVVSNWIELVSGAKADVFISILQNGGDGAADPALGPVAVEFR